MWQKSSLLLWGFLLAVRLAAQDCEDRSVFIREVREAGMVRLYAETTRCLDVTITVKLYLENLRASQATVFTVETRGRRRMELAQLLPINDRKAWRYTYDFRWFYGGRGGVPDATVYELPFEATVRHRLIQGYQGAMSHQRGTPNEYAQDWDLEENSLVLAARAGVVVGIRQDSNSGGPTARYQSCANYVCIRHKDNTYAEYVHLAQDGVIVALGDAVTAGQPLARSGNTGYSHGPHLHFAVFRLIDGTTRETLPVKFKTKEEAVESLQEGRIY